MPRLPTAGLEDLKGRIGHRLTEKSEAHEAPDFFLLEFETTREFAKPGQVPGERQTWWMEAELAVNQVVPRASDFFLHSSMNT